MSPGTAIGSRTWDWLEGKDSTACPDMATRLACRVRRYIKTSR